MDLFPADSGLTSEGEGGQRPVLRQVGAFNAPSQSCFLPVVPLGAQEPGQKLGVREVFLFGGADLFVVNLQDAFQVQVLQQLIQLVTPFHLSLRRSPSAGSSPGPRGAGSCARPGPGRRVRSGPLRTRRPEAVPVDSRAPGEGAGAERARAAWGCVA